jgi:hypothetical protein
MGSISFGHALVAGRKAVPKPATGNTARVTRPRCVWRAGAFRFVRDVIGCACRGSDVSASKMSSKRAAFHASRCTCAKGGSASLAIGARNAAIPL